MSPSQPPNGIRLLVVDDHADTLNILARLLDNSGYAVQTATSLAEATALCQHGMPPFDLLLSDLTLEDGTGADLLHHIRAHHFPIPAAIALSGHGQPHDQQAALDAGFDEFLLKPITLQLLLDAVSRLCPSARPVTAVVGMPPNPSSPPSPV